MIISLEQSHASRLIQCNSTYSHINGLWQQAGGEAVVRRPGHEDAEGSQHHLSHRGDGFGAGSVQQPHVRRHDGLRVTRDGNRLARACVIRHIKMEWRVDTDNHGQEDRACRTRMLV
jgi:hypothetical protein